VRFFDVTHLGRSFLPQREPTHRSIVLIAFGTAIVALGIDPSNPADAARAALGVGAAWTLAREIDPDRPASATAAGYLTAVTSLWLGPPAAGPVFLTMITARILSRSTGLSPKGTDLAVVVVGALTVAGTPWGWAAGIVLAFALVRDATLSGPPAPAVGVWAIVTAVGVTGRVVVAGTLGAWTAPSPGQSAVVVAGLIADFFLSRPETVSSPADATREPLDPVRIRHARLFSIAPAIIGFAASGGAAVVALAPLWLAALSTVVVRRGMRGIGPA